MNTAKRIRQVAAASKAIVEANLNQKTLRQEIGKELRQLRLDRHIKGITLAAAIKETAVFVYMVEQGMVPMDAKRITKIYGALEKLGRQND